MLQLRPSDARSHTFPGIRGMIPEAGSFAPGYPSWMGAAAGREGLCCATPQSSHVRARGEDRGLSEA